MLRSMYSGISGLRNFQTKLDVIGNNIANVNTAGYKKGRVTFKDAMNQMVAGASASTDNRGGKNSMQVGLGGTMASIDTIHTGSSIQTTNRPQDLAIEGDGYFVIKQGNQEFYTRAGNFYLDDNGLLVNADGYKVQAYQLDANGNSVANYGDIAINVNAVLPPTKTTSISISGNLDPTAISGSVTAQQIKVVDSVGKEFTINVHYKRTDAGWDVFFNKTLDQVNQEGATGDTTITYTAGDPNANPPVQGVFDVAETFTLPVIEGANFDGSDQINLSNGGLTDTSGVGITVMADPDGYLEGKLESYSIGQLGEVNGVYSNGQIATLGRIALAKFSNPSGLNKAGGNLFQETVNSGVANTGPAGDGRGTLASGSLEMSNVDLSEEFTEMITAQRGFQANTRIITTSDEILQELVNLKR